MKRRTLLIVILALLMMGITSAGAENDLMEVAEDTLQEKVLHSGTLDLYDEELNRVRNLRLIEVVDVYEKDGAYAIDADYRDINSGDIVSIEARMVSGEDDFTIGDIEIQGVQAMDDGASGEAKEYTDTEIQSFMKDYVAKQGQFNDGKIMLYDQDNDRMRNLQMTELNEEVRRMGKFYNSSAKFADANNGDVLDVDISVENENGTLTLQALRIRNVRKAPAATE